MLVSPTTLFIIKTDLHSTVHVHPHQAVARNVQRTLELEDKEQEMKMGHSLYMWPGAVRHSIPYNIFRSGLIAHHAKRDSSLSEVLLRR